jgi:type IV secretion system protein VirB9
MKLRLTLLAAICLIGAASAHAQATVPQPSDGDPRIRVVTYAPNQVIGLRGHLGYQMTIEFDPAERIENVSIGDSLGWQVTPNRKATLLFLKPVEKGAATNMTVITTARSYAFELTSREAASATDPSIIYMVRFRYPASAPIEVAPPPPPPPPPPPEILNFAYSMKGARGLRPSRVFDNGVSTFFEFPPAMETPAILMIGPTGKEELANLQSRGKFMVVDAIGPAFVLRYGNQRLEVKNDSYVAHGAAPNESSSKRKGLEP